MRQLGYMSGGSWRSLQGGSRVRYPLRRLSDIRFYCRVSDKGVIYVGERTSFNYGCVLIAHERIEIGRGCLFGPNVHVYDFDHGMSQNGIMYRDQPTTTAPVRIGDNVWFGANVVVLKGVTIGDNAVIAANSVICKDVPANTLVHTKRDLIYRALQ